MHHSHSISMTWLFHRYMTFLSNHKLVCWLNTMHLVPCHTQRLGGQILWGGLACEKSLCAVYGWTSVHTAFCFWAGLMYLWVKKTHLSDWSCIPTTLLIKTCHFTKRWMRIPIILLWPKRMKLFVPFYTMLVLASSSLGLKAYALRWTKCIEDKSEVVYHLMRPCSICLLA